MNPTQKGPRLIDPNGSIMPGSKHEHHRLDGHEVTQTAAQLVERVSERFPDSGLVKVSARIHETCAATQRQIDDLTRPIWPLRALSLAVGAFALMLLFYILLGGVEWDDFTLPKNFRDFIGLLEPVLGSLVFLTAFFIFISSLEQRWKQRSVLQALNGLRSLAHVIDMHQLTKNPERLLLVGPDTASSPKRTFTPFQLGRYLDYCSEMLSILSKVSALWAQAFPESKLITAVDQIEMLSSGLSNKIWQKLMVLKSVAPSDFVVVEQPAEP
jgi:hypothetical protein